MSCLWEGEPVTYCSNLLVTNEVGLIGGREPTLASFARAGTVICKRMPCRAERGDCLFHLGTPYRA